MNRKIMGNGPDSAELQVSYAANVQDMLLERQCLVKNDTEVANRHIKRNIDLIDLHRKEQNTLYVCVFCSFSVNEHLTLKLG